MVTLNVAQMNALDGLGLGVGPVKPVRLVDDAKRAAKFERRMERWAKCERSAREGFGYSRGVVRRLMKVKDGGGAKLEWQMARIIP